MSGSHPLDVKEHSVSNPRSKSHPPDRERWANDQSVGENRFSLISFAREVKQNRRQEQSQRSVSSRHGGGRQREFRELVDEIRSELVQMQGRTEEEKKEFSELLNRAVLGFREQRNILLAKIQDMLIKKGKHDAFPAPGNYSTLAEAIFAEVIGLNVLELVLKSKEGLEEVQVVGRRIFEVRGGRAYPSPYRFESVRDVERIQQNLVLFNQDVLNRKKRWAEAMLSDGSRVTMTGFGFTGEPTLTIRFFTRNYFPLDELCRPELGTIDETILFLLRTVLKSRFNLVIIGATNTGKTNLIKSLVAELPDSERIVTIETRFELQLKRDFPDKNVIEFEVDEEDPLHSSRQAFKLALRQSPERIIHAEIRDEDANIYVRACTRGHEGSMTTVHVSSLEDAPDAIADMCMLDGRGMNPDILRRRIAEYVTQIGIEMANVDGQRKVVRIAEFSVRDEKIQVTDLVRFDYQRRRWLTYGPFSKKAAERILKHDRDSYERWLSLGMIRK